MSPPRRQRERPAPAAAALCADWRDMISERDDLTAIAGLLCSTARFAYRANQHRGLPAAPELTGDGPADLDAVDQWLHALALDNVRTWAWSIVVKSLEAS